MEKKTWTLLGFRGPFQSFIAQKRTSKTRMGGIHSRSSRRPAFAPRYEACPSVKTTRMMSLITMFASDLDRLRGPTVLLGKV